MRLIKSHVAGSKLIACRGQEMIYHREPAALGVPGAPQVCVLSWHPAALGCGLVPRPLADGWGPAAELQLPGGSSAALLAFLSRAEMGRTTAAAPPATVTQLLQHARGWCRAAFPWSALPAPQKADPEPGQRRLERQGPEVALQRS